MSHLHSRPGRPRKSSFDPHINRDRWLVSYADFMTLLFAFFTTMYAISTVDNQKLTDMVDSMRTAFDTNRTTPADVRKMDAPKNAPRPQNVPPVDHPGTLEELKKRLSQRLEAQITGGQVGMEVDPRGLVITIREAGVFQVGSADLSAAARTVLAEVASAMEDVENPVRVEGHTDDVPIHTARFQSNWELSTARATAVITFFVQERGLSPTRFSAAGYGEFHPRATNDSESARAQNRRVDIVILNDAASKQEPTIAANVVVPSVSHAAHASTPPAGANAAPTIARGQTSAVAP